MFTKIVYQKSWKIGFKSHKNNKEDLNANNAKIIQKSK